MSGYSPEFFVQKNIKKYQLYVFKFEALLVLIWKQCNNHRFGRIKKAELISKNYKVL